MKGISKLLLNSLTRNRAREIFSVNWVSRRPLFISAATNFPASFSDTQKSYALNSSKSSSFPHKSISFGGMVFDLGITKLEFLLER